jgi:hypothetical protein
MRRYSQLMCKITEVNDLRKIAQQFFTDLGALRGYPPQRGEAEKP